jgi:hypothetical protein
LSKECSIVWINNIYNNVSGTLECLPHIRIFWGNKISEQVKSHIEDFTDEKNGTVFVSGDFKIFSIIEGMGLYSNSISIQNCFSLEKKQKIEIYASPLSVIKENEKKWSGFQGNMPWNEAKSKCESIGMRLPTKEELEFAPREKWNKEAEVAEEANVNKESGVMDFNAETDSYWALYKLIGFPSGTGEDNDALPTEDDFKTWKYSVRCIEGKEFKFKK